MVEPLSKRPSQRPRATYCAKLSIEINLKISILILALQYTLIGVANTNWSSQLRCWDIALGFRATLPFYFHIISFSTLWWLNLRVIHFRFTVFVVNVPLLCFQSSYIMLCLTFRSGMSHNFIFYNKNTVFPCLWSSWLDF